MSRAGVSFNCRHASRCWRFGVSRSITREDHYGKRAPKLGLRSDKYFAVQDGIFTCAAVPLGARLQQKRPRGDGGIPGGFPAQPSW